MTNEALAMLIGEGGNDEFIPLLWDKVKPYIYSRSDSYYRAFRERCDSQGITSWDIRQAAYTAFLKAIEAYSQKGAGLKFTTFCGFPLRNALRGMLTKDPLNTAVSLDKPLTSDGVEGEPFTLGDVLPDTSEDFRERLEEDDARRTVSRLLRAAIEELTEQQQKVINGYFYDGLTLAAVGEQLHISPEAVRSIKRKALTRLSRPVVAKPIYEARYGSSRLYSNTLTAFRRTGVTNVELEAMRNADSDMHSRGREREQAVAAILDKYPELKQLMERAEGSSESL